MKRIRVLIWLAVLAAFVAMFAARRIAASREQTAPRDGEFGQVPAFALRDQQGATITDTSLRGKIWVASFLFTRCPSVCPLLTAKLQALGTRLADVKELELVSISVDPEHDTPDVLRAYASKFGADARRWHFLTGPLADIEKTVVKGFKIQMGEKKVLPEEPTLVDIVHGEHFVLVDMQGTIRGYFPSDEAGIAELEQAVRDLR